MSHLGDPHPQAGLHMILEAMIVVRGGVDCRSTGIMTARLTYPRDQQTTPLFFLSSRMYLVAAVGFLR